MRKTQHRQTHLLKWFHADLERDAPKSGIVRALVVSKYKRRVGEEVPVDVDGAVRCKFESSHGFDADHPLARYTLVTISGVRYIGDYLETSALAATRAISVGGRFAVPLQVHKVAACHW